MLTAAPSEVASPAMNAYRVSCDASAIAKIGASVESEPSMRPTIAGWTRWRRKVCSSGHSSRVYQAVCKAIEHKALLTNGVRAA